MKDNEIVYSYNRLLAQYKDMEKQMELKETEWKKIQKRYSVAEELARELCEMILAKDKAETGLGENYSWSSLDIIELIKKAKSSFQQYNANRAKLLKSLYKQSEDRRIALEAYMSKPIEKINSASPKLKTTVEQAEKMIDNPGSKAHIEALSDEFDNEDLAAPVAGVSGPSIKSTPVKHNNDDRKRKVPDKGSANIVSHYELTRNEADGILKELKPSEKILLQVFGDTGYMEHADLLTDYSKLSGKSKTVMSTDLRTLGMKNIVEKYGVNAGLIRNTNYYRLTGLGEALYTYMTNKKPEMSMWWKIIQVHASLEHGMNIIRIAEAMREYPEVYTEVDEWQRHNSIEVEFPQYDLKTRERRMVKGRYIPDIAFKYKGEDRLYYIEFERNTCSNDQFAEKCEKMCRVNRRMLFVVPNKEELLKIQEKINIWIKNKGEAVLKKLKITISVATILKFKSSDMKDYKTWDIFYDSQIGHWEPQLEE